MPYCTQSDIQTKVTAQTLVQLTDDQGTGLVDSAVVVSAIKTADTLIDTYLRRRYALPLSPVPDILGELAVQLAIYDLYQRRMRGEMPDDVVSNRKNAVRILEHISDGSINLLSNDQTNVIVTNKTASDVEWPGSLLDKM